MQSRSVALTGPNGCGKSTLLSLLALTLSFSTVEHFSLYLDGPYTVTDAVVVNSMASVRRVHLGYISQFGGLLPYLTIRENCLMRARVAGLQQDEVSGSLQTLAMHLGVSRLLDALPAKVSTGERQRASILQAVIHRPSLILADEPTGALHPSTANSVMSLFADLTREMASTLLISTHDAELADRHGFEIVEASSTADARIQQTTFAL
jgi:putative ABC transport system ATP-binding protein